MECTIEATTKITIVAEGVTHPTHAINRVKKYLRENNFEIVSSRTFGSYIPPQPISLQFNELKLASTLTEDDVIEPNIWFDRREIDQIHTALRSRGVDVQLRDKIGRLIDENNPL